MFQSLLAFSIIASLVYLAGVAVTATIAALRHGARRDEALDAPDALATSRFTIPVSLIVPLVESDPQDELLTLEALVALNYPEFEVICVVGARHFAETDWLLRAWDLSAYEFFYRRTLPTSPVRRIYRSARDPRLTVVEMEQACRADAANCGLNLARFRYAGIVDPGVVFERDALLRAMTAALNDPASVVATCSHVEAAVDNQAAVGIDALRQRLRSIRSLMETRVVGSRNAMGPDDAVLMWRRDGLLQMGGFSTSAADADLDMMIRLQTSVPEADVAPAVVRTATVFGAIAPRSRTALLQRTERRQRAVLEAVAVWLRGERRLWRTVACFAAVEIFTPLSMMWVLAGVLVGVGAGWLPLQDAALAILTLSVGQALVSAAALLLRGSIGAALDERTLKRLLLFAPCELVLHGPASAYARLAGAWTFLKTRRA